MKKTHLKLVEVHGKNLTTTSLIIAELFGRKHSHVLRALERLSTRLKIVPSEYRDSSGKTNKMYILDERSFLIAMPFIGGEKSEDGQVRLVDEFLRLHKLQNQEGRKEALQYKRDTARPMTDMLTYIREGMEKETKGVPHCSNEHKLCNWALTGYYAPLDESSLDAYDAKLLGEIRQYNTLLMTRFLKQPDRRPLLAKFVDEYHHKHPKQNRLEEVRAFYLA